MNYVKTWVVFLTIKQPVNDFRSFVWVRVALHKFDINNDNVNRSELILADSIQQAGTWETKRKARNQLVKLLAATEQKPELKKLFPVLDRIVGGVVEQTIIKKN